MTLQSANPADPPVIQANHLQHEADLLVLAKGIQIARQLAHANGDDRKYKCAHDYDWRESSRSDQSDKTPF